MDIKLLPTGATSSDIPGDVTSLVQFSITEQSTNTSSLLTQIVLKSMLTRKGSVITDHKRGSILANMAGSFNVYDAADAAVKIQSGLKEVETQVKQMQSKSTKYRPSERLQSLQVKSLESTGSSIKVSIVVVNELNKTALLKVSM